MIRGPRAGCRLLQHLARTWRITRQPPCLTMFIGRVSGTVVSSIKDPAMEGQKLLLVERLSPEGALQDPYMIAVDTVQAGVGDTVLVLDEGNGARQVLAKEVAPIRTVIVGIVDAVTLDAPTA